MTKARQLSRRTVLRGIGASIALPMLDAMTPSVFAAVPAVTPPKRIAFFFVPNGVHLQDWTPRATGYDYDLPYILEPLSRVRDDVSVLSGLTHDKGRANSDGAGDHARSASVFLTGAQPRKTSGANIRVGISADQIAAQQAGSLTRFPSLEIGCDRGQNAGNCDSGYSCAYSSNISWRSESSPMTKEVDPKLVFNRLFDKRSEGSGKEIAKRNIYRSSILDLVSDDARQLSQRLGGSDKRKIDEYLTGIREIELRLNQSEKRALQLKDIEAPEGIPGEYADHLRLMCDMMIVGFQTDMTRIATCMFANAGSNRSYSFIGVPEGHHTLSHHGGDAAKHNKIRQINRFHVTQFAYMIERMKSIREPNGSSLLDNCMIVYGSGLSDGNRHNNEDLPVLFAGHGGGTIRSGRHIKYERETPMTNLFMAMLDRFGTPTSYIGDSTGSLQGLS